VPQSDAMKALQREAKSKFIRMIADRIAAAKSR
jgi:hypothetical protein